MISKWIYGGSFETDIGDELYSLKVKFTLNLNMFRFLSMSHVSQLLEFSSWFRVV